MPEKLKKGENEREGLRKDYMRRKIIEGKMSMAVLHCHSSTIIAKFVNVGTQNIPLGTQESPIPSVARPAAMLKIEVEKKKFQSERKKQRTESVIWNVKKRKTHASHGKHRIFLVEVLRQSGRSTTIDSAQECLTSRLRRRVVGERPCLHSRKHVRRVHILLLRWPCPGQLRLRERGNWRGDAVSERGLSKAGIKPGGLCINERGSVRARLEA
jgi:hypothetical protein